MKICAFIERSIRARRVFYQSQEINNLICDTYPFSLRINITLGDRFFREYDSIRSALYADPVRGVSALLYQSSPRRFSAVSSRSRIFSGPALLRFLHAEGE